MHKVTLFVLGTCFTAHFAMAADADEGINVSLRAAEEPAPNSRPWDQGAAFSYQNINGNSTWQTDAVLKGAYLWYQRFPEKPGQPAFTGGNILWKVSAGPYSHKLTGSNKPQNDRGISVGIGGHLVPGGDANGPVKDYDFGITISTGKKLTPGTGTLSSSYFDVESDRQIASIAMYLQPTASGSSDWVYFFKFGASGYSDNATGSQNPQLNGRTNGVMGKAQLSVAPLGLDPMKHQIGAFGFAPIITFNAQTQHDTSSTGGRFTSDHRLYSATLSIPLVNNNDKEYNGPVPSIDVKRSTGADLLESRENKGVTSITLNIKY